MVYNISYRRPARHSMSNDSLSTEGKAKSISDTISSGYSGMSSGIPEALSFDRILDGGVCPPCTLRDFMNYLRYIELCAENLQFYIWFRDYEKRFQQLPDRERVLSPIWTLEQEASAFNTEKSRTMNVDSNTQAIFQGTGFNALSKPGCDMEKIDPFSTPPMSAEGEATDYARSEISSNPSGTQYSRRADTAFQEAGLKWKPFTVQPYREEISRIIAIYLSDESPRELNISSKERAAVLHALSNTTHPSAFRSLMTNIEWSLRCQSHPNFIRWTICNGNRPRVVFARMLGVGGIVGGIAAGTLITLSSAGRGWRVLAMIGFMIGISTLIAAWKGMCVVLHGMHHRHLRPWELFVEEDANEFDVKRESFDSMASNSFEDEPWIAKYDRRNIVRKVFDREVWIQEPALRQIQDTIFIQSILGALILSAIATGVFVALPYGNLY